MRATIDIHDAITQPPMPRDESASRLLLPQPKLSAEWGLQGRRTKGQTILRQVSVASVFALLGVLLLLYSLSRPLLSTSFFVDALAPSVFPFTDDELGVASGAMAEPIRPVDSSRVDEARALIERSRSMGAGMSPTELTAVMWDVQQLSPQDSAQRRIAQGVIASYALLGIIAVLLALYLLSRRLAGPDRMQAATQLTLGSCGLLLFGILSLFWASDPTMAQQIVGEGALLGLLGSALIFVTALGLRGREWLLTPASAVCMLASLGTMVTLTATL